MTYQEFKAVIQQLAKSQGFYSRLLKSLNYLERENSTNLLVFEETAKEFKTPLDIIMYFEQ